MTATSRTTQVGWQPCGFSPLLVRQLVVVEPVLAVGICIDGDPVGCQSPLLVRPLAVVEPVLVRQLVVVEPVGCQPSLQHDSSGVFFEPSLFCTRSSTPCGTSQTFLRLRLAETTLHGAVGRPSAL